MRRTFTILMLLAVMLAIVAPTAEAQNKTVLDYPKSWTGNFETAYQLTVGKRTTTDTLDYLRVLPGAVTLTIYVCVDTASTADTAHYYIDARPDDWTTGRPEYWTTIDSIKTVTAAGIQRKTLTSADAVYRIRRLFTAGSATPSFDERVVAAIKQNY